MQEMKAESLKTHFLSQFKFLREHKGWRKSCLHTLIGTPSGGKTTLIKTILIDLMENAKGSGNIGIFLSEQDMTSFMVDLGTTGYGVQEQLDRLHVRTQQDECIADATETPTDLIKYLDLFVVENEISILMIDNITTTAAYESGRVQTQTAIATALKKVATKHNIPVIVVAHVGGNINEGASYLIDQNHIRGGKAIVNLSEYFYVLQKFEIGSNVFQTLRITKHRHHEIKHKFFTFRYSTKARIYVLDTAVNFKEFKELYKQRNTL